MKPSEKKKILLFLSGQTVSLFGSMLVQYAIGWHITLTEQSGSMLTIATICGFLPQVLISLFAGVWADRFNRKMLIILADAMIAVSTAVLAALFTLGYEELWLLFVISAIRSLGAGIQTPAVSAFLPDIVPQDQLMRINGVNASIQGILMFAAPIAAGALYGAVGLSAAFWVDVGTAVIGISLLALLKVNQAAPAAKAEETHIFREMFSGMRYVFSLKWLRQFLGFYFVFSLMFGPVMFLTPLMLARSFGEEPWRLVLNEVVGAVGMIAGGLIVGILADKFRNKVVMITLACVAFGVTTFVLGIAPNFWFYLGVMLPLGVTIPFVNTGSMTVLQLRVQPDYMGRVFSLVSLAGSISMPLSMAVFGPIADKVSVELLLMISGGLMILIALGMTRFKEVLAMGRVEETVVGK